MPLERLTIGVVEPADGDGVTPDVRRATDDAAVAVRDLGFATLPVALPHPGLAPSTLLTLISAEASAYHLPWLNARPEDYAPNTRRRLELAALMPATLFLQASRIRRGATARRTGSYSASIKSTIPR